LNIHFEFLSSRPPKILLLISFFFSREMWKRLDSRFINFPLTNNSLPWFSFFMNLSFIVQFRMIFLTLLLSFCSWLVTLIKFYGLLVSIFCCFNSRLHLKDHDYFSSLCHCRYKIKYHLNIIILCLLESSL
jgi:hypothetical protein